MYAYEKCTAVVLTMHNSNLDSLKSSIKELNKNVKKLEEKNEEKFRLLKKIKEESGKFRDDMKKLQRTSDIRNYIISAGISAVVAIIAGIAYVNHLYRIEVGT